MKTREENKADTALIVKSLKVLGNIEGGGIYEIKKSIEAVRRQSVTNAKQVEKYWESLSSDGIITSIEKQSLKREMANIERSESAITTQAAALGYSGEILDDYVATYEALYTYIFETLRLFDDMEKETLIDDRAGFNSLFSNYFYSESFVMLAITQGILDTVNIRVLSNLMESGEEGETALYHGGLYQYTDGRWKAISTGNYKGARDELPAPEEDSFFLASDDFVTNEVLIVNGTELLVNGTELLLSRQYLKGYIYYVQEGVFYVEADKSNWRYAAAFADVLNVTGELPQIFQDGLDALQEQIDATNQNLSETAATLQDEIATKQGKYTIIDGDLVLIDEAIQEIVDRANEQAQDISDVETSLSTKISHLPEYLGPKLQNPSSGMLEGDFYLYIGNSEDYLKIRRWNSTQETWETLSHTEQAYRNYYMIALEDIFAQEQLSTGTFSALFAQSFWTACADIDTLDVQTIYLREYGAIQSANATYVSEDTGLKIDADGNIDANGDVHLGATPPAGSTRSPNKVAIGVPLEGNPDFNDYDVVIGGNVKISGALAGATGTFSGYLDCGVFKVLQASLDFEVLRYDMDQGGKLYEDYLNRFGGSFEYSGPVYNIYGPDTYLKIGDEIFENIYIYIHPSRPISIAVSAYHNGEEQKEWVYIYASGYGMYNPLIVQYIKIGTLMYGIDLPTSDPHIIGAIWNNNGTLKLSSG